MRLLPLFSSVSNSSAARGKPAVRRSVHRARRRLGYESLEGRALLAVTFDSAQDFETAGSATASEIAITSTGETYLSGGLAATTVDLDPGHAYADNRDIVQGPGGYIAKYNVDQSLAWARVITNSSTPPFSPFALAVDAAGAVYASRYFVGTAQLGTLSLSAPPTGNNDDFLIAKIAGDGAPQWIVSDGISQSGILRDIAVDPQGQFLYFVGHRSAPISGTVGTKPHGYIGRLDLTQAAPTHAWRKELQANVNAGSRSWGVTIDAAGNAVTAGWLFGTADFDPHPSKTLTLGLSNGSNSAGYVWKLKPDGSLGFAATFQGNNADAQGRDVAVDAAGNMLVAGVFRGTVDFDPGKAKVTLSNNSTAFNGYLAKLTSTGAYGYAKNLGVGGAYEVELDAAGSIYVGRTNEILKLNASGVLQQTITVSVAATAGNPDVSVSSAFAIDRTHNRLHVFGGFDGALHTNPDDDGNPATPALESSNPNFSDLFWLTFNL